MYITNDPVVALIAQHHKIDRIWIDLETLGKAERQRGMNSVKSNHSVKDIRAIAPFLTSSKMMVRVNPWNEKSEYEIDQVIHAGAEIVMLPMWKSSSDVRKFIEAVNGRAKVSLLLETKEAEQCLDQVLNLAGVDEIHIGLNDLHLSYGLHFMFELLANGTVERICKRLRSAGVPYGFGGIAKPGEGLLPAELILGEHYRLRSSRVIVSRSFCDTEKHRSLSEIDSIFAQNIDMLRHCEERIAALSEEELAENHQKVIDCVRQVVQKMESNEN